MSSQSTLLNNNYVPNCKIVYFITLRGREKNSRVHEVHIELFYRWICNYIFPFSHKNDHVRVRAAIFRTLCRRFSKPIDLIIRVSLQFFSHFEIFQFQNTYVYKCTDGYTFKICCTLVS